jgi:hypothetical protein
MSGRGLSAVGCAAALLPAVLVGCGSSSSSTSSSGIASKPPAAILAAVSAATRTLSSVQITGLTTTGGHLITFDLRLAADRGGEGNMALDGASFRIVAVGNTLYISGSRRFWRRFAGNAGLTFAGKWLKVPETGGFASFADLTNLHRFFAGALAPHDSVSKGAITTVDGRRAVLLVDRVTGGTMYVAASGTPYPLEIVKRGALGSRFSFGQFNQPVTVTPPPSAIDVSKLT